MIQTDPLSLLFVACFLIGLVFFLVTALLGNLSHGHTVAHGASHAATHPSGVAHTAHTPAHHVDLHAGHIAGGAHQQQAGKADTSGHSLSVMSFLNPTSVMLFLLGFGFFGYLFHNIVGFVAPILTLMAAGVCGIAIAAVLLYAITRLFGNSEWSTEQDVSDRTGLLGKVSLPIQENGMGEILYVTPGGMRKSIPARSIDGRRLERDMEVVVINFEHGVAAVDTWEHFIHEEEGYSEPSLTSASDNLDQLRNLLEQSGKTDSQPLVMHNDAQKE